MKEVIHLNGGGETLPKAVYYQCVWTVRDIDRLKLICEDDEYARFRLGAIYKSLEVVPLEYREDVLGSVAYYGKGCSDNAHENTWKRWKKAFITELAFNLKLI